MSNLNKFALSGMLFMFSILLANGMYSNQIFALDKENGNARDQNGNLNEAKTNAIDLADCVRLGDVICLLEAFDGSMYIDLAHALAAIEPATRLPESFDGSMYIDLADCVRSGDVLCLLEAFDGSMYIDLADCVRSGDVSCILEIFGRTFPEHAPL